MNRQARTGCHGARARRARSGSRSLAATNSKDVRRLRAILKDPVAKDCFLQPITTITDALEKIGATKRPRKNGLVGTSAR